MPIPGSNITTLRRQLGMSIRDLAKEAEVDVGNLSKLEAGKIGYSKEAIERIAAVLKVSLGVLFSDPGVVEAAALHMRQAPMLTGPQLATWSGPDAFDHGEDQEFLYLPLSRASRHVFALRAEDDRNAPSIVAGDELIFDAKGKPVPGACVVALDAAQVAHIGRLRPIAGGFEVVPALSFSLSIESTARNGLALRGVLVEIRRTVDR